LALAAAAACPDCFEGIEVILFNLASDGEETWEKMAGPFGGISELYRDYQSSRRFTRRQESNVFPFGDPLLDAPDFLGSSTRASG
jgi:hypothetical protein